MADHLSPAARAIVAAFSDRHELCGPFDGNWHELCLAAAFRAAADQVVPEFTTPWNSTVTPMISARDIRAKFLAIAAELGATNG